MRTIIVGAVTFFLLASPVFAGTVPVGGSCPNGTSDCAPGLACSAGTCVNPSQNPPATGVTLINPLKAQNLTELLTGILDFVIRIGTVVVILMMVYVGFMFVTAQGNESKLTTAKRALLWTIIGALILLGSQAIALGIKATVGAISS